MKERKLWDINEFNKVNLPEVISNLNDQELFSKQQGVRVLDLPIKMPQTDVRFPDYIPDVFRKIAMEAISFEEKTYGGTEHLYVYITIDQKTVQAGNTGRRAGAHSDAYIERNNNQIDITESSGDVIQNESGVVSHTYIICDCLPTEFFDARFPLKNTECTESLKTFNEIAEESPVITYNAYTLLRLDPYVVHRAALCDKTTERTFMKISISNKKYSREGNTHNHLFEYNWTLKKRMPDSRNHPW